MSGFISDVRWPRLILSLAVPQLAGGLGAIATGDGVKDWFPTLCKPPFNPPSSLFAPVWTMLYLLMGVAEYLIDQEHHKGHASTESVRRAQRLYALQLSLNTGWSFLFFKFRRPFAAFIELLLLLAAIMATMAAFARVSRLAAWLLAPYLAWSLFATLLNGSLFWLNRDR